MVSSGNVLSSGAVSSLIAAFGFLTIIDDIVLLSVLTAGPKFLTQIVDTFLVLWSSLGSIYLNNGFSNSLLKASTNAVWTCLYFVVAIRLSRLYFNSSVLPLNSGPLSH